MEILGLFISLIGSLILAFGASSSLRQNALESIQMRGFSLKVAAAKGKQRISVKIGFIIYALGTAITILGITIFKNICISQGSYILSFIIGIIFIGTHFKYLVPSQSKKSMLATLKIYYFEKTGIDNWNSCINDSGWRQKTLKEIGLKKNLSKEQFEEKIKSVRI
jgi:hypothetical protein